jgi:hypothetical protein
LPLVAEGGPPITADSRSTSLPRLAGTGRAGFHYDTPGFLLRLVALAIFLQYVVVGKCRVAGASIKFANANYLARKSEIG